MSARRVSAQGTLVAAPKLVLKDAGSILLESDIRTDPVSGDTWWTWWTFPAGGEKLWVAGGTGTSRR